MKEKEAAAEVAPEVILPKYAWKSGIPPLFITPLRYFFKSLA